MYKNAKGFTLVELLIVVAIIALISVIAYPSYMNYVVNTKRNAATNTLLQIADRQQQFFLRVDQLGRVKLVNWLAEGNRVTGCLHVQALDPALHPGGQVDGPGPAVALVPGRR